MMMIKILEVVIAAGLLNVWIVRFNQASPYRGSGAQSMKEEFSAYGLPVTMTYLVGALKILAALLLIAGLWYPAVVSGASILICLLMVGAIAMHLKIKDPLVKSLPALMMLCLNVLLLAQVYIQSGQST